MAGPPWTRKHDDPRTPLLSSTPRTIFPQSLPDLIDLCQNRAADERFHAAGSHWALSRAALSDHTFIETHDPREQHPAMGRTLTNVIPKCLDRNYVERMADLAFDEPWMLAHIESGKRIYQLCAELDIPMDVDDRDNLAGFIKAEFGVDRFAGPWGFATLGGAGGQTVVGAFNTGTHGGDFDRGPVADSIVAMHIVSDGGRQFWLERPDEQLTDDDALRAEFEPLGEFDIIRDDQIFNAALVSVGRFGIIYSVILRAVPQYSLYEKRRLHLWQDVKSQIKDRTGPLFADTPPPSVTGDQRFLQIAVSLTTHAFFQRNLVGITKRWNGPSDAIYSGRDERRGTIVNPNDPVLNAPRFDQAGTNFTYSPDPDNPHRGADPGMLERACSDASFLRGVLTQVVNELEDFTSSNGAVVGAGIATVAALGGGGLLLLIPALLALIALIRAILDAINDDTRFGEVMNKVKDKLLDPNASPDERAAGLFAWQLIYYLAFSDQQSDRDYAAISYAVMDQHDYRNRSCEINVDSIEVFFNALDDRLVAFVDALIAFEMRQEFDGKAFLGYASLRFTQNTHALLGEQQWPTSCAIEVACLSDVTGGTDLINYAAAYASNPNVGGVLHWGQHNEWTTADVERVWGDSALIAPGNLTAWRAAVQQITGGDDAFSNEFTRRTGLEP